MFDFLDQHAWIHDLLGFISSVFGLVTAVVARHKIITIRHENAPAVDGARRGGGAETVERTPRRLPRAESESLEEVLVPLYFVFGGALAGLLLIYQSEPPGGGFWGGLGVLLFGLALAVATGVTLVAFPLIILHTGVTVPFRGGIRLCLRQLTTLALIWLGLIVATGGLYLWEWVQFGGRTNLALQMFVEIYFIIHDAAGG